RFGKRGPFEPADEAEDIGRHGREELLQMRLAVPDVARSPHAGVARRLGKRAFHSAAGAIDVMELGCLLARPRRLEHLVALWREADRHAAPRHLGMRALPAERTGLTGRLGEPDLDNGLAFGIRAVMPGDAVLALWTGHDVVVPVDVELGDIEGARG